MASLHARAPGPLPEGRASQDGKSKIRLAMMLSWTSLVPPSIELALVRSHARGRGAVVRGLALPFERVAAARGHQQLVARLVQLGAVIFHHRRLGGVRPAGLQFVDERLGHRRERLRRAPRTARSARAGSGSTPVARGLDQRIAAAAAEAHARDHLALMAEQVFGDVPALVLAWSDWPWGPSHCRRRSRRRASSR